LIKFFRLWPERMRALSSFDGVTMSRLIPLALAQSGHFVFPFFTEPR